MKTEHFLKDYDMTCWYYHSGKHGESFCGRMRLFVLARSDWDSRCPDNNNNRHFYSAVYLEILFQGALIITPALA